MNYRPENAAKLIDQFLAKANERLESAEVLLNISNLEDSISRAYYAILDAATACLVSKDVVPKSHSGAMKLFSLHFIKSGLIDKKYQRYFARIEKARIEADYLHNRTYTLEEASDILKDARQFVCMATQLFSKQLTKSAV